MSSGGKIIDLCGLRFGRLIVVRQNHPENGGRARWECECDCGRAVVVASYGLRSGTQSCGCLHSDVTRIRSTTHGHNPRRNPSPTLNTWWSMKHRCLNPKDSSYPRYGGIGIGICERWMKFENFLEDMGERPAGTTIDRFPNQSGNYEPGNCRWATRREQANNTKQNKLLTWRGETMPVAMWASRLSIPVFTLYGRISRGWAVERALVP